MIADSGGAREAISGRAGDYDGYDGHDNRDDYQSS
jgi:hypothetical protein